MLKSVDTPASGAAATAASTRPMGEGGRRGRIREHRDSGMLSSLRRYSEVSFERRFGGGRGGPRMEMEECDVACVRDAAALWSKRMRGEGEGPHIVVVMMQVNGFLSPRRPVGNSQD